MTDVDEGLSSLGADDLDGEDLDRPRGLQEHLDRLEREGNLLRVSREINKDTELHPLVRWQFRGLEEAQRKAFLFENVVDSRGRRYDIPVVVGALAASGAVYATGIGCDKPEDIPVLWEKSLAAPVDPVLVPGGACQEVVYEGEHLLDAGGLDELPIPVSTPGFDNAPYFNSAIWITKDPETGVRNAAIYRGQVKSPLRTGVFADSHKHAAIMWQKCHDRGIPLEAAAVIGAAPSIYYSAVQIAPYGVDELSLAGALQGRPVEVVKCRTVDLEVPANAEIVIEGRIRTDLLEPEGSFGEAHGYCDPRTLSPVFEVTAITHRRRPVYLSILSQVTPSESSGTKQAGYEAQVLRYLRDQCGLRGVARVCLVEELLNHQYAVIVMRNKASKYEAMNALYALQAIRRQPKFAVAVDDDIDPMSASMVNWAIVNRSQPHKDLKVIHPRPIPFGPLRLVAGHGAYDSEDSSVIIDATKKTDLPPVALPRKEYMDQAREIWEELGLPTLQPRAPWYGYELGMWPEESAEEATLAVTGRYYETGEKLAGLTVAMPPGSRLSDVRRQGYEGRGEAK
jgi:UbiD family decarboxylase